MITDTSVLVAGRYRLESRIAAGGMGEVWRGTDEVLDRPVAVKLLHAEYARHPQAVARFRAEAQHAAALSHPGIAQIYDYGDAGTPYLVMELVDGPSLAEVLQAGPLDPGQGMDVVAQAAAGLQAAHSAGVVHGDIKPGNLLVGPGRQLKITDFGICRIAGEVPVTSTGSLLGTPAYLAPELLAGEAATPASDLYSLGVVAWECLAGTPPFTGDPVQVAVAHRDRPLPPLPGSIPADVTTLVTELTAKDPKARPQAAGAVAERAERLRAAPSSRSTLTLVIPPYPPAQGRRRGLAAASRAWRRAGWWPGKAATLAAGIFIAVAVLGVAALGNSLSEPKSRPPAPTPAASAPRTVDVTLSSLKGQPLADVQHRLQQLGLRVQVRWQPSDQEPGTVLALQPSGQVPAGSVVVLTVASKPLPGSKGHGNGDGHGNGNGDGNGNGHGGDGGD